MEAKNIRALNSAIYVMRHFVELSATLLPIYERLTRKGINSFHLSEDKRHIETIYQSCEINPKTGEFLLGSNIMTLIKKAYNELKFRSEANEKKAQEQLKAFQAEYERLKHDWYITAMN